MVKVPLLFYLTLLVTLPSLYVFNALVGSRLTLATVVRLAGGIAGGDDRGAGVAGADRGFFLGEHGQLSVHALVQRRRLQRSGVLGLSFLLQTLHRLSIWFDLAFSADDPEPNRRAGFGVGFGSW